jgi:ornithine cyclodeaminase/alanine dehydrogenase-like protein (mu-crystallin family)
MTLHINEAEVRQILTMPMAMQAVEEISRKQALGQVVVHPRRRFELPAGGGFFHYMAAMDTDAGFIAMKQYTYVKGVLRFLVPLYEISTGALLALIEADFLGQQRTGAASGAAILGTGGQAKTQLEAISLARKLDSVRVFGREPQRRESFCAEMSARLRIPVQPAASAGEAVRGADIVNTATTSTKPVLDGNEITEGAHINAIGANHAHKRELDDTAISRTAVIFVDSIAQSQHEAGDLIIPFAQSSKKWDSVHELYQLVGGQVPGRTSDKQITLFKSNGIASWDLAVAEKIYTLAKQKNLGRELPLYL